MTTPDTIAGRIENEIEQARKRLGNVVWQLSLLNLAEPGVPLESPLHLACSELDVALAELRKPAIQRLLKSREDL